MYLLPATLKADQIQGEYVSAASVLPDELYQTVEEFNLLGMDTAGLATLAYTVA